MNEYVNESNTSHSNCRKGKVILYMLNQLFLTSKPRSAVKCFDNFS